MILFCHRLEATEQTCHGLELQTCELRHICFCKIIVLSICYSNKNCGRAQTSVEKWSYWLQLCLQGGGRTLKLVPRESRSFQRSRFEKTLNGMVTEPKGATC